MHTESATQSFGTRYRILDTLGQGGMGTVLLAKDRLGGRVALKRLGGTAKAPPRAPMPQAVGPTILVASAPDRRQGPETVVSDTIESTVWRAETLVEAPASATTLLARGNTDEQMAELLRLTLAREFHLLASLRHPNIISVLDYGFDDDLSPYFTMELLEGAESILTAAARLPFEGKLDLLGQMLQALAYLHRRGVIHRDLKPGNVMVVRGQVKVLDFGVSTVRAGLPERGSFIVGTLAYMAPELLTGAQASEASDLYAVGTIAYELFAGRHPFDLTNLFRLRDEVMHRTPDLSSLEPALAKVVGRLLEKRPAARHESVDELFADLAACTGQPLEIETAATRESFLQAAELVGRDAELGELSAMLVAAVAGAGGGALVGGESGVGKSRLLDELRARALVEGVVVLRGQAASEGGGPYHVFREVLRGMALHTELDDFEAGVLAAVVPDIEALLEREVPERDEIDPEAAQARLLSVVEDMFRRQRTPVLVILEDLHWAGSESLRLLSRLTALARGLPLLFVGSYRDDERSDLPRELGAMRVLKLGRLTGDQIAALAASMLGEAGRRVVVVERLKRETEGNPFFLVEVVRSLAEDAGALSRVGIEPMPATLPAGGVHLIVGRRLDQVPRRARPLLEAAAVVGRRLDPALLRRIDPEADVEAWIQTCADAAVIDVDDGAYRFAHDKLREGLLSTLAPAALATLHRKVAEAIFAEHGDAPEHIAALAHHWARAGDLENEARYSALAGELALQSSAYREAAALFERAIAIVSARTPEHEHPHGLLGRARAALEPVLPRRSGWVARGSDRFRLGVWEGRLAEAYGRLADHAGSIAHGRRALAHLGQPMPAGQASLVAGLPVQAALRGLMTLRPEAFAVGPEGRSVLLEALRIHTRITEACFFTQEALPMFWSGLAMLNLGEPAGPSATLACGYAMMAAVAGVIPLHPMADAWGRRALSLVEDVGKPYEVAFVLQRVCSYRLWTGEWDVAETGFQREIEIAKRLGEQRMLGDAMLCMVFGACYRGHLDRVAAIGEEVAAWSRSRGDAQSFQAAQSSLAWLAIRRGDAAKALALCRETQPAIDEGHVSHEVIRCHALLALAATLTGDRTSARRSLDRALELLGAARPVAYWTFDGTTAAAEAALLLWEATGASEDRERARLGCKAARVYASVFPIGAPFALLWEGCFEALSGRPRQARRAWDRCVSEAERLRMPYERGRAYLEMARRMPAGEPERARLLRRAGAVFAEVGSPFDAARVERAMGGA